MVVSILSHCQRGKQIYVFWIFFIITSYIYFTLNISLKHINRHIKNLFALIRFSTLYLIYSVQQIYNKTQECVSDLSTNTVLWNNHNAFIVSVIHYIIYQLTSGINLHLSV